MILMLSMNWTAIEKSTMRSYRSQCIAQEVRLWCQQGCNILPRKQLQSVSSYSCQETRESPRIKQKPTSIVPCLISLQIRKVNFPDIFRWLIFSQWCALQANWGSLCCSLVPLWGSNDIRDEYIFFIPKNYSLLD